MTIPPALEAQILRYHHVGKWRVGTIARQLRVHHEKPRNAPTTARAKAAGPNHDQIRPKHAAHHLAPDSHILDARAGQSALAVRSKTGDPLMPKIC